MSCEHRRFWVYMPPLAGCRCGSCVNEDVQTWELWCDDQDDCDFQVHSDHPAFRGLLDSDDTRF